MSEANVRAVATTRLNDGNEAGAQTVEGYLRALLAELWRDEEGFNGKRPFGNSGWQSDIYGPLVRERLVPGKLDADGCLVQVDSREADKAVLAVIAGLAVPPQPTRDETLDAALVVARVSEARNALVRAALRYLSSYHDHASHANADAEAEYATEQLALAARQLFFATNHLPSDEQPVGWLA
jgi:hypothetical protein